MYSTAFRRLANVTQVVGPLEGYVFHNRLTHSLEVAQIARRLVEKLQGTREGRALDADLVEAAALAHDIGHPPFGHVAEEELGELAREHGCVDGFEGNAQSFRILVRLAELNDRCERGLDLTRGVLNGVIKYPWTAVDATQRQTTKFNVYNDDLDDFGFARGSWLSSPRQSIEAQIMDVADDIAYSVHDVDDLLRAGLLPINELSQRGLVWDQFVERWLNARPDAPVSEAQEDQYASLLESILLGGIYRGTRTERAQLRTFVSRQITTFTSAVSLLETPEGEIDLVLPKEQRDEIAFLKRIVWDFVIENPRLASAQAGHRRIVRTLFTVYRQAIVDGQFKLIPPLFSDDAKAVRERMGSDAQLDAGVTRLAVDIAASFSDDQATAMYERMLGLGSGRLHAVTA